MVNTGHNHSQIYKNVSTLSELYFRDSLLLGFSGSELYQHIEDLRQLRVQVKRIIEIFKYFL